MSDDNKRLLRRALEEIYAQGDLGLADELVHPDFVDHEHVYIWRVADGRIAEHWGSRDDLGRGPACDKDSTRVKVSLESRVRVVDLLGFVVGSNCIDEGVGGG